MLAQLQTVIDEALATDVDGLSDAELHELTVGLQRAGHRLAAAVTRAAGRWDARQVWADDGSRSPGARLARECGMAESSGRAIVNRARKLRSMPLTDAAFAAGELSTDAVDLLRTANSGRARSAFERDEALLVGWAKQLRHAELKRLVAYWRQCADDEGTGNDAEAKRARRSASAARTISDMVHVRGWLDPVGGTIVLNELQRLERQLYQEDLAAARERLGRTPRRDELGRDPGQRMADAFVEMARRSAVLDRPSSARPLLTVLVGWETLHGRICQLADGTVLHPNQLDDLVQDCDLERVVFGSTSRVIDVGVRSRFFRGGLRRAIEVRDRHCRHASGCDVPYERCDVDHGKPYSQGGLTTQDNGQVYCPTHNRNPERRNPRPHAPPDPEHDSTGHIRHRLHRLLAEVRARE